LRLEVGREVGDLQHTCLHQERAHKSCLAAKGRGKKEPKHLKKGDRRGEIKHASQKSETSKEKKQKKKKGKEFVPRAGTVRQEDGLNRMVN